MQNKRDNRTPSKMLEDDTIEFYAALDEFEEGLKRHIYLEQLKERFRVAIANLVNVQ